MTRNRQQLVAIPIVLSGGPNSRPLLVTLIIQGAVSNMQRIVMRINMKIVVARICLLQVTLVVFPHNPHPPPPQQD